MIRKIFDAWRTPGKMFRGEMDYLALVVDIFGKSESLSNESLNCCRMIDGFSYWADTPIARQGSDGEEHL
jgi:hypothetical protein